MCSEEYKLAFATKLEEKKFNIQEEIKRNIIQYINSNTFDEDMRRLFAHDWFLPPPRQVMIKKRASNRYRFVYCFDGNVGYLLKYMTFVLQDFDYLHVDSLCSFRKDNRTNIFFHNIRKIDPDRKLYIAKADVHNFGGSIDQDILLDRIQPIFCEDPDFLAFAKWLMTRNEFYRHGRLVKERVSIIEGLPIGNFFNNIYLRDMDMILEPEAVLYMRYTDDIAFLTDSMEKAKWAMDTIRKYVQRGNQTINEEKTHIYTPGEEVELLGIQMFPGGFDIGDYAIQKLLGKLRHFCDRKLRRISYGKCTCQKAMHDMIRFYDRMFFGKVLNDHELNWVVHAFPIISRIDGLKKIDAYAQDCIRIAGTGKKTDAKYRMRYKDIKNNGYRSLVHAYYHGYELYDNYANIERGLNNETYTNHYADASV